jgi:peroxiredoxin
MRAYPVDHPAAQWATLHNGRRRRLLATLALPSLVSWGGVGCGRPDPVAKIAPRFSYTLLDGTVGDSADLRGQVMLVSFWATSCAVCVKEMPELVALHNRWGPHGLQTLAVAVRHDPPALVAHFAQSRSLPFGVVIDNTGAITDSFGSVRGTPTTFVIDRQGHISQRIEGAPNFAELHERIAQLLARPV